MSAYWSVGASTEDKYFAMPGWGAYARTPLFMLWIGKNMTDYTKRTLFSGVRIGLVPVDWLCRVKLGSLLYRFNWAFGTHYKIEQVKSLK